MKLPAKTVTFLVVFLVVFLIGIRQFILASNEEKINIFPEKYERKGDGAWANIENIFNQDLGQEADLASFSLQNSTYIVSGFEVASSSESPDMEKPNDSSGGVGSGTSEIIENANNNENSGGGEEMQDGGNGNGAEPVDASDPANEGGDKSTSPNIDLPESPATEKPVIDTPETPANSAPSVEEPVTSEPSAPATEAPAPAGPTSDSGGETSWFDGLKNFISRGIDLFFSSRLAKAEDLMLKESLVFKDFSIPGGMEGAINNAQLRLSLAGMSETDDKILVEYSEDEESWTGLGELDLKKGVANKLNGGYYLFGLPVFDDWTKIDDIKIRLTLAGDGLLEEKKVQIYVDALWLEVAYEAPEKLDPVEEQKALEMAEAEKLAAEKKKDSFEFKLLSKYKDFKIGDKPRFEFEFRKREGFLAKIGSGIVGLFFDEYKDLDVKSRIISLDDPDGETRDVVSQTNFTYLGDGKFVVELDEMPREMTPGNYQLEVTINEPDLTQGLALNYIQDFSWGVLAFNVNKSIYLPDETAYLQMAVLNEEGHTLCNSYLTMEITAPDGGIATLSTENGLVTKNPECGPDNVIASPDYYAYYLVGEIGEYDVKLIADTKNGVKEIHDSFEVRETVPFEIERTGPTRIYPWSPYKMSFSVKANQDFQGDFTEYLPDSFQVIWNNDPLATTTSDGSEKSLKWQVDWHAGETYDFAYIFDAPKVSPEFYLLGEAEAGDFRETRNWQVAADAEIGNVVAEAIPVTAGTADASNWTQVVRATSTSFTGNRKYLVYVTSGFTTNNNAATTDFQIRYGANVQYTGLIESTEGNANRAQQISWFDVYDQPSTPLDIILDYRTNANTSYALNAQIFAINLSDLQATDYYYASNTTAVQHTTSMVGRSSVTLNNAKVNGIRDWLVMGMEEVTVDSDTVNFEGELYDGTSAGYNFSREGEDTAEEIPYVLYQTFADVDNGTTFSIRSRDDATGSNDHRKSRVFALNLDAFESHKSYYNADVNTTLAAGATWAAAATTVGNLNGGGNYTPMNNGNQMIFSSFVNQVGAANVTEDDRLYINNTTAPTGWTWNQGGSAYKTSYDASDFILNNVVARYTIPSTGYPILLQARDSAAATRVARDVSMTVFSLNLLTNMPPTGIFNTASTTVRRDGTGIVDISIRAYDINYDDMRARVDFATGTACNFSAPGDPTLDENASNITADYGSPRIYNNQAYQIGSTTGWISAVGGNNNVTFDWFSATDLANATGTYCLRLTVNDSVYDQATSATTTVTIDNRKPTAPGNLIATSTAASNQVRLIYGATTTEDNFSEYRIYYHAGTSTDVTESDILFASTSDANLANKLFNGAASTTITGLDPLSDYAFNIWAYDAYGNKASATPVVFHMQVLPSGSFNQASSTIDGSGRINLSIEVDDLNDDPSRAKLEYQAGNGCSFLSSGDPTFDAASVVADFGAPIIDNNYPYQIGTTSGWIRTASGSNSVALDWLSSGDVPAAEGIYCLRLTVNDNHADQAVSATTTLIIDNVDPTAPGTMTGTSTRSTRVNLAFGTPSADGYFSEYKIYYKAGTSGVTEGDTMFASTSDINLADRLFNSTAGTIINGLAPDTDYVFNIWAYDQYGNKASSTEVSVRTPEMENLKANSVMFIGGRYSGNGAAGQNSNTNQTFSPFNFKLAESGVEIRNAFIIFEIRYESYANNAGNYTSYNLSFDTCSEPCTAVAFTGTSSVNKTDSTVLAYNGTDSNQVRLIFDVTDEAQLAAYAGEGGNLEGQIGYRVNRAAAVNSISYANATLVVTYAYDDNSSDITNTVIYPLESNAAGDSGTKRAAQTDDCTLNSTCPTFAYNVLVAENHSQLSQWYQIYTQNDIAATNDQLFNVNIEGADVDSATYYHEAANGGAAGTAPAIFFSPVSGFSANTAQNLEVHGYSTGGNATYYLFGGEAFETYAASNTASVKTRTVSFPIGVINNGLTTAKSAGTSTVFFPENGIATGTVSIKKAWFRLVTSNYASGANTITVSSKTGGNTETAGTVYNYNMSSTVVKPSFNIFHVIPTSSYAELENANATTSKDVTVYTTNSSAAAQGGMSGELMITYTYSDASNGYLSSLRLSGGQIGQNANVMLATTPAAAMVAPEILGTKTIRAGALLASYAYSDSDAVYGQNYLIDANLSTGTSPICTNAFVARQDTADGVAIQANSFVEFYKGVASSLVATDQQAYTVCYSNDGAADADNTAGAKMGGVLNYTYSYTTDRPMSMTADGQYESSGMSAIANGDWIDTDDAVLAASANLSVSSAQVDFYYEVIDNSSSYRSSTNEPSQSCVSGTAYGDCPSKIWRVVSGVSGMAASSTATVADLPDSGGYKWQVLGCADSGACSVWKKYDTAPNFKVDTTLPTAPGNLAVSTTSPTTAVLDFGTSTIEANFSEYKIFYKKGSLEVAETDIEHDDADLDHIDYNGTASTTVGGLEPGTQYVVNIWAYDLAGNKTKAAEQVFTTASKAHSRARTVYFPAGVYNSNGTSGQNSNTDNTFAEFSFRLAESGVDIRNAYVVFNAQYEAYTNGNAYTGYTMTFDACADPCTPDAFAGSGRSFVTDATTFANAEGESNVGRILLDVSNESQLAAYSGGGTAYKGQVGYRLNKAANNSSIASARAVLVLTYDYDDDNSAAITNTVVYPLESNAAGDSGTKRNSQADDCVLNSTCPTFNFNAVIPEISSRLSYWFDGYLMNSGNGANDVTVDANIETQDVSGNQFIIEAANGGDQSNPIDMNFGGIYGFSENASQNMEMHPISAGAPTYYLLGGEVYDTYTATKTSAIKTRTVSFPIGVLTNGLNNAKNSGSVNVYFPENGGGSGNIDIKKAWFRIINSNDNTGAETFTVSSKAGDNSESSGYAYVFTSGGSVIKPSYKVIHVMPSGDYGELETANAETPKAVTLYTTNSVNTAGGVSAELMITYTYVSEASGYLSTIDLYSGQPLVAANQDNATASSSLSVFPELKGSKTLRAAAMLGSFLVSDSDGGLPANNSSLDMAISTGTPSCTASFYGINDAQNFFVEYYKDVTASYAAIDNQSYDSCFAHANAGDTTAGAKMNAKLVYTYQYDAPAPSLTQNNWRWYAAIDDLTPTSTLASEKEAISGINIGDALRLRLNIGVESVDLSTSSQSFKLQFAKASDCTSASGWADVGAVGSTSPWAGFNNPTPIDGQTIPSSLLSSSTVRETYEESVPSVSNPRAVPIGGFGEWDWNIYNNGASSSADYCFRAVKSNGSALSGYYSASYPKLTTASGNTAPNNASNLQQYYGLSSTTIANQSWIATTTVRLRAGVTDMNLNEALSLYFELVPNSWSFTISTSVPASPCASTTAYSACASKIWLATSTAGDYRTAPFTATATVSGLDEVVRDYKWQVLACDDSGECSAWADFGTSPNFRVDATSPTAPGNLVYSTSSASTITLNLGASSTEANFYRYRIFYRPGSSGVRETDDEQIDGNLNYQNYNGAVSTIVNNLSAGTQYVFRIWAYDAAGNKATSVLETLGTTTSSFTPPTGALAAPAQKTDGSGAIDLAVLADDPDNDNSLRIKVEYELGVGCSFVAANKAYIDQTDANTTATYGDPKVDNALNYQVGTSTGWIMTAPGSNWVFFDWLSKANLPGVDDTYCIRTTVNDGMFDQAAPSTRLIIIDNLAPTTPGALTGVDKDYNSITLDFGGESTDNRFSHYKIFYKEGTSGVSESDIEHIDSDLDEQDYGGTATTTVGGLKPNTQYVFNIWAYDTRGNRASSTEIAIKTNAVPANTAAYQQYRSDGSTAIANGSWLDESGVWLEGRTHDIDNADLVTFYYEFISATGTFTSAATPPASSCASGLAFGSCGNKIWAVSTTTKNFPSNWYGESWLYRKRIVIASTSVASTETNFTVLATTTDADLAAKARADGFDIVFTSADGLTKLNYEREYYSSSTGELAAWIKTGISTAADTILYMYYGNSAASIDNATTTGAWDANYKGVWHLDEAVVDESSAADAFENSASSSVRGSQYGTNEMPAQAYRGQEFDGNDYVAYGSTGISARTVSFWVKADNVANQGIIDLNGGGATVSIISGAVSVAGFAAPTVYVDGVATTTINADWHFVTVRSNTAVNANNFTVGRIGGNYFSGLLDEVRLSDTARTANWIMNEYRAAANSSSFAPIGTESRVTSYLTKANVTAIPDSSAGYKWQVIACDDDGDCSSWARFDDATPNIKIDTQNPSAPGALSSAGKSSSAINLAFGLPTDEANFLTYRIFYGTSSPVTESSTELIDANLGYKDYNGASITTVAELNPQTAYYFNIWAYDQTGHKASSTQVSITTNGASSTPGAIFYTKNTRVLFYRVWTGTAWGAEQTGPTLGSGATDYIRQIRVIPSDENNKIAIAAKTWDGTNQEWWGTVYRFTANNFVNTTQLGAAYASANYYNTYTGCLASLSDDEFFLARDNGTADGSLIYSWSAATGWSLQGSGPNPVAVLSGCKLTRRPGTDNYILSTQDADNDIGVAYYYGGSTYSNSWTAWNQQASAATNLYNFSPDVVFDPSDNTRAMVVYSGNGTFDATVKKLIVDNSSINFGSAGTSPANWSSDYVDGLFAADPAANGTAYLSGRDTNGEIDVYQVDMTGSTPVWTIAANGANITGRNLYSYTNYSEKTYDTEFYKNGQGVILTVGSGAADVPRYRIITAAGNSLSAASSTVPGADNNQWVRVKTYPDPNESEFLAVFQNDDVDYSAVFWDGGNNRFYNTANNPGSGQVWTQLVTASGAADRDDEITAFSYASYNQYPHSPSGLNQAKSTNAAIANGAWTNENQVQLAASAKDADTSEIIRLYAQLIPIASSATTTLTEPAGYCGSSDYAACASKIWRIGSSTAGDYSVTPYSATTTITNLATSSSGYKWQVMACDDSGACSGWVVFNATTPNFKVDFTAPTRPGSLSVLSRTSSAVTLGFGASTTEANFLEYRIYYKLGATAITEADILHGTSSDPSLGYINYNGKASTTVLSLASSTLYSFNIYAYDQAGNRASSSAQVSTTTASSYNLSQSSFLIENDDAGDVNSNTAEVSASTTLTNVIRGSRLNIRVQIENNGGDVAANKVYKLQYNNLTDAPGTWSDLGASTEISYAMGLSGNNTDIISSAKASANARTWTYGSWHEGVNQTANFTLGSNAYTEFVFAIKTNLSLNGKTYRFRLYNVTDSAVLNSYANYASISTISSDSKRYSKGVVASLPSDKSDLEYYFDPQGYANVVTDESIHEVSTSSSNIPAYLFATKHTGSSSAISVVWNGQSDVSGKNKALYLQVYRHGSVNAWQTVATESNVATSSDFDLMAEINYHVSEYYDTSNWTYWRVYQAAGAEALRTDSFTINFSAPTAYAEQLHYRWRNDDGSESGASWKESEDAVSPNVGDPVDIGATVRLRMEVANRGGGTSTTSLRMEYAYSETGCASDPGGWAAVPTTTASAHFVMATSTNFANGAVTTAQLSNIEGYAFVAGRMVQYPGNQAAATALIEDRFTEMEYLIKPTAYATVAGTYCFRVTNAGAALDNYARYATLTLGGNTNHAPSFSTHPSDNGSASSAPTNSGVNISFTAVADDIDDDSYYLAVCKTNSIAAGNDTAPTCGGGNWCISGLASSSQEASCDYAAADAGESLNWYAFACDRKAGFNIAKCSAVSQGTGDAVNDSPFVINHPPSFTAAAAISGSQNPGGTFIFQATSTDSDSHNGNDTLTVYVCRTNNASFGGCSAGIGDQVCAISATTTPNPKCTFTDTAPTPAGATSTYVFVYDNHGLAATANSRPAPYTILNTPPNLGGLLLNGGNHITLNLKGAADVPVSTANASVVDLNGCSSLVSATAVIYFSNVAGAHSCAPNSNSCYQISTANCTKSECSGADDSEATYTCSTTMKYYAIPTDASANNPNELYDWLSRINVFDGTNYSATTSPSREVITSAALTVVEPVIDFGSNLFAGDDTGNKNSTTTIENIGNSPIDTNLLGTDMVGNPSGLIPVDHIEWNLTPSFNWSTGVDLNGIGATVDIVTPKATTTAGTMDQIYWGLGIPFGAEATTYHGQNTFYVIIDNDNWN